MGQQAAYALCLPRLALALSPALDYDVSTGQGRYIAPPSPFQDDKVREKSLKRKTAKEILASSFRELAQTKSIEKITVADIAGNCGYSSATFYRQFRDKYDLIAWEYSQHITDIMNRMGEDGYTWEQTLIDGVRYFQENQAYLANLLQHTSGHDAFILYMSQINREALSHHIQAVCGKAELDPVIDMCVRIYSYGTVFMSCAWIMDSYPVTAEQLAEAFRSAVPLALKPYLLPDSPSTK